MNDQLIQPCARTVSDLERSASVLPYLSIGLEELPAKPPFNFPGALFAWRRQQVPLNRAHQSHFRRTGKGLDSRTVISSPACAEFQRLWSISTARANLPGAADVFRPPDRGPPRSTAGFPADLHPGSGPAHHRIMLIPGFRFFPSRPLSESSNRPTYLIPIADPQVKLLGYCGISACLPDRLIRLCTTHHQDALLVVDAHATPRSPPPMLDTDPDQDILGGRSGTWILGVAYVIVWKSIIIFQIFDGRRGRPAACLRRYLPFLWWRVEIVAIKGSPPQ